MKSIENNKESMDSDDDTVTGGLISEVILNKRCLITPLSRKFELSAHNSKQLIHYSAQGRDLAPYIGNGTTDQS